VCNEPGHEDAPGFFVFDEAAIQLAIRRKLLILRSAAKAARLEG
jgi:hypothetical protein